MTRPAHTAVGTNYLSSVLTRCWINLEISPVILTCCEMTTAVRKRLTYFESFTAGAMEMSDVGMVDHLYIGGTSRYIFQEVPAVIWIHLKGIY